MKIVITFWNFRIPKSSYIFAYNWNFNWFRYYNETVDYFAL